MSFQIEIQNDQNFEIDPQRLTLAAQTVLEAHDLPRGAEMSIVITTNEAVAKLNLDFREIDAPTDVLSFPADDLPDGLAEMMDDAPVPYLGDIIIAYPYALAQAEREGHDVSDSFALLAVHGTLHLLGYDHDTLENRAQMWATQDEILTRLNISTEIVPSLEEGHNDASSATQE